MKHFVVHSNEPSYCTCRRFKEKGECLHVSGKGLWKATYIVSAVSGKQAEQIVQDVTGLNYLLHSFPLPMPDSPEIHLEVWRDQIRATDVIHTGTAASAI